MPFNLAGARREGYADKDILSYLAGRDGTPVELLPGTDEEKIAELLRRRNARILPYEYRGLPNSGNDVPETALRTKYSTPSADPRAPRAQLSVPPTPASAAPVRRDMSPAEINALWSEQGIQPTVAPVSLLDLAMEGVGSFADEADVAKYLLPASLLGLVRYKRPGVSAAAREAAETYHRTPVRDALKARDAVFHATGPEKVESILKTGEIVPTEISLDPGVSVSRVPRVASKGTRAVSLVIDPEKMPPSRPYVEPHYEKTLWPAPWAVDEYGKPRMNPAFEFENRTYGQAIPLTAAREIWVDKSALPTWELTGPRDPKLKQLRQLSEQFGIPLREFETGKEMQRGRATLSDLVRRKRK